MANKSHKKEHIDVPAMLTGNVRLFDAKTIHKMMNDILKETYLETSNDESLQQCTTVNDAISCTASKFRERALEKLKEKF